VTERASSLAKLLLADKSMDNGRRIERLFCTMLTRKPTDRETNGALRYIDGVEKNWAGDEARQNAWQSYCRVLMTTNEFIYID
jgi:hypothetical protein